MSSKKRKHQGDANGSSRNLDGRRLRTIAETKALAEYLAVRPEMDKREKEERRKRWEQVVDMAERKQDEIKSGGKARLNEKWVDAKEDATEKTREAVIAALTAGEIRDVLMGSEGSESPSDEDKSDDNEEPAEAPKVASKPQSRTFFGWDEEEEELSDSDDDVDKEIPAQKL
jgi:hypothetical protein